MKVVVGVGDVKIGFEFVDEFSGKLKYNGFLNVCYGFFRKVFKIVIYK